MSTKALIAALTITLLPHLLAAQEVEPRSRKSVKTETRNNTPMPSWASAHNYHNDKYVYFPDYYTFYSPERGYIYWQPTGWATSANPPAYMTPVDLSKARLRVLRQVQNNANPEQEVAAYMQQYPASAHRSKDIPVPPAR